MSSRPKKPTLTVANLFKNHSDRILRLMLQNTKRGWSGPELAQTLKISNSWAARALATLEFEKFAVRDGKKPHGKTYLTDPDRLMQRWKLSYHIDFNEHFSYRVVGRDPIKLIALAAKKEGFRYAVTGAAAKAISSGKKYGGVPYVYVWPYSGVESDLRKILKVLQNDEYDLIPTEEKANLVLLRAYAGEGVFEESHLYSGLYCTSELQISLDTSR